MHAKRTCLIYLTDLEDYFCLLIVLFHMLENNTSVFLNQYSLAQTSAILHTYSTQLLCLQLIRFTHSVDFFGLQNP